MFDIAPSEFLLVAFVALVVIGPKDLPKAMRVVGYWVGKARGVARQFRTGFDNMVREAELEEMEKRWASENERIMREHPQIVDETPATETTGKDADAPAHDGEAAPVMVEKPVVVPAEPVKPVEPAKPVEATTPVETPAPSDSPVPSEIPASAKPDAVTRDLFDAPAHHDRKPDVAPS